MAKVPAKSAVKSTTRSKSLTTPEVEHIAKRLPWSELVTVNARGGVTLPKKIREAMADDSPVVRMTEVGPGQFILEIVQVIPAGDAWFYTPEWQAKELEADADIAAKRWRALPPYDPSEAAKT